MFGERPNFYEHESQTYACVLWQFLSNVFRPSVWLRGYLRAVQLLGNRGVGSINGIEIF